MSNEADSKHTLPTYRWGETSSEVPDAGVVEPSGGKKDTGWSSGDQPNRQWWNWLHWATGVIFRYIQNFFTLLFVKNSVMPAAGTGEGAVTAGVGLSVNVAEARVLIDGSMYTVPAATNLAITTADATHPRIDAVVAKVTAGVPAYVVVAGTASASPSAPSVPANSAIVATVRINAAAVAPSSITDQREFGVLGMDRINATKDLRAGEFSSTSYMLRVLMTGSDGSLTIGQLLTPLLTADSATPYLRVKASAFGLLTAITRKWIGTATDWYTAPGFTGTKTATYWQSAAATDNFSFSPQLPEGATITAIRVWGTRANDINAETEIGLFTVSRAGLETPVSSLADGGGALGPFMHELTGLSTLVDNDTYGIRVYVEMRPVTSGDLSYYTTEIEYTEQFPFLTV